MNQLFVKEINPKGNLSLAEAEHLLENQTVTHHVDKINWKEYSYRPDVLFRIGHTGDEIWLKYYVAEKHLRAVETNINGDVYKDSCVEFFISHDNDNYYNLEFSCIGTVHLAWGPNRHNRKKINPELINKISIRSTLGNQPFDKKSGDFQWEMMIRIPIECFTFSNLKSFNGLKASGNFYKCGDETEVPHFVTWNPVQTNQPDYHRPEYFGSIEFE